MAIRYDNLTPSIKNNRLMVSRIKRRINRIKRLYGSSPAIKRLEEMLSEQGLTLSVTKDMSTADLKSQMDIMKHFEELKTSTVKGMQEFIETNEVMWYISQQDPDFQDMFYSLYQDLVEENGILEKYKYQIFDIMDTLMATNISGNGEVDIDYVKSKTLEAYRQIYEKDKNPKAPEPQLIL